MEGIPFWQNTPLDRLTHDQWESLCDGCGKCCCHKIEDEQTAEIYLTDVGCKLLDLQTISCRNYNQRKTIVPMCLKLTPGTIERLPWLPETCAYRLRAEGKPLPPWHHLVSGNRATIHEQGHSVYGKVVPETVVKTEKDWLEHITDGPLPNGHAQRN